MRFVHDAPSSTGEAHLRVSGELSLATAPQLRRVLGKLLLDQGRVLVDVSAMTVAWSPALTTFASALAEAGGWPLARLVLVGPEPGLAAELRARRVSATVQCADGFDLARTLLDRRPASVSRRHALPCIPEAAALARSLSDDVCADWELPGLAPTARVIAGELTSNAVQHARTGLKLRFTLGRLGLFIGVRDWRAATEDELRFILEPPEDASGLALVKGLAHNWNVTEHVDGKTVWAALRTARVGR